MLDSDPANAEALGALGGLYERSKDFDKLVEVLEKQAEVTYDNGQKVQILTKLGTIYGDRLNNDEGAVTAWRSLLAIDPNDRKAQEALKKKYLALGRWDDLEVFYAESGKWDEFIRVLEQQEAKETERRGEDRPPLQDRRALGGQEAEERSRRARLREGPRARAAEPARRRGAHPDLLAGRQREGARQRDRGQARSRRGRVREARAPSRGRRRSTRARSRIRRRRSRATSRRSSSRPGDERTTADVERAAKATDQRLGRAHRGLPQGDRRRPTTTGDAIARDHASVEARSRPRRGDAARSTRRSRPTAPSTTPTARTPMRSPRSSASTAQTARFADLLGIYEKRRELSPDHVEKKQISYEIAKLYETELKDLDRAIDTYNAVLEDEPTDVRALAALDVLYRQLERWEPYVDTLRRRIELDVGEAELIDLKYRLGQTLEKHTGDAGGRARELPRDPLPRCAARRRARGARGAARQRGAARRSGEHPREHLRGARRLGEAAHRARHPERVRGRARSARRSSCARSRATAADARRPPRAFDALAAL